MKRFIYFAFAVALVACTADLENSTCDVATAPSQEKIINSSDNAQKGTILVYFDAMAESRLAESATRGVATRTGIQGVDALLDKVGGYKAEPVFVVTEKNRKKVHSMGLHLWYELCFDEAEDLDSVASQLAEVAEVQYVEFSQEICRVGESESVPALQMADSRATINVVLDPLYPYQWSLRNLGSASKVRISSEYHYMPAVKKDADINIEPAWKLCYGDPSIVVAVVDEGVMFTHEDLRGNMWVNTQEIAGDGVDNDENGYIDDVYGYNFVRLDSDITWDRTGDKGHGTHVAGIISAERGNRIGVSGIAGGSGAKDGVKIMSVQIVRGGRNARIANTAKGIQYAADNGAHILQNSWGYKSSLSDSSSPSNDVKYRQFFRLEANAIDYFVANAGDESGPLKGGLVIFSAGNDGAGLPCYPSAYKPCIAVASFGPALKPAYYTNYGEGTDIVAPGGSLCYINGAVLSTMPAAFGDPTFKNYGLMQGTSMACPHVSGVAALGLSYAKKLGKRYTAEEFRSMLLSATNDINPYLTGSVPQLKIDYTNYQNKLGAGYIDAYKMLLQIDGTPYSVVGVGSSEISLSPYFGSGVAVAEFKSLTVSDEDKERIGWDDNAVSFENGTLKFACSQSGTAKVTVSLLVGGGSLSNENMPQPVEVTKTFVLMVKSRVASNGGWL